VALKIAVILSFSLIIGLILSQVALGHTGEIHLEEPSQEAIPAEPEVIEPEAKQPQPVDSKEVSDHQEEAMGKMENNEETSKKEAADASEEEHSKVDPKKAAGFYSINNSDKAGYLSAVILTVSSFLAFGASLLIFNGRVKSNG